MDVTERLEASDPIVRIEAKIERLQQSLAVIETTCPPCRALAQKHEITLFGNGKNGVMTRLAGAEQGRVDTLSVKSVCILVGAIGTLAATIGAAMAAFVK